MTSNHIRFGGTFPRLHWAFAVSKNTVGRLAGVLFGSRKTRLSFSNLAEPGEKRARKSSYFFRLLISGRCRQLSQDNTGTFRFGQNQFRQTPEPTTTPSRPFACSLPTNQGSRPAPPAAFGGTTFLVTPERPRCLQGDYKSPPCSPPVHRSKNYFRPSCKITPK